MQASSSALTMTLTLPCNVRNSGPGKASRCWALGQDICETCARLRTPGAYLIGCVQEAEDFVPLGAQAVDISQLHPERDAHALLQQSVPRTEIF